MILEELEWLILILHNWKGPRKSMIKNQKKSMPRETEKRSLMTIDGKPTGGTSTRERDQDGHGMMTSEIFLKGFVHMY